MNNSNAQIFVIEPNMNSSPHSEINAGFLSLLELLYNNNNILNFIADPKHIQCLEKLMELTKWNCKEEKVLPYAPKYFLINEIILIKKIFMILINTSKQDKIYFLGIMPFSQIFVSFLNKIYKREIFICLHGQMEAYLKFTKIGFSKYYYRSSQFVFKQNDNISYIIFGDSIKKNLLHLFNKKKRLISIDQPYLYKAISKNQIFLCKKPIKLGFVGRFEKSKNVKEFFKLVDFLEKELNSHKVLITIVGKVGYPINNRYKKYITYYDYTISKEKYEEDITKLDFVLTFTDSEFYRATPSGVFFDSIKYEVPVLALDNEFVSYYFEKYGKIGEIFKNTFEMVEFIKLWTIDIDYNHQRLYKTYMNNILSIKNQISVNKLKLKFLTQL